MVAAPIQRMPLTVPVACPIRRSRLVNGRSTRPTLTQSSTALAQVSEVPPRAEPAIQRSSQADGHLRQYGPQVDGRAPYARPDRDTHRGRRQRRNVDILDHLQQIR
jgi:hypothetical protein